MRHMLLTLTALAPLAMACTTDEEFIARKCEEAGYSRADAAAFQTCMRQGQRRLEVQRSIPFGAE